MIWPIAAFREKSVIDDAEIDYEYDANFRHDLFDARRTHAIYSLCLDIDFDLIDILPISLKFQKT